MPPLERHVFVCENLRDPADARGCCASKGAAEVRSRLRVLAKDAGFKGRVRINAAGCLDQCAHGVTIVVYPEAVWYTYVDRNDIDEIIDRHVVGGEIVERLKI